MFDNPTLMKILLKLPFEEALEKQLVCRAFYDVICDNFFWTQKLEQDFGGIDDKIELGDSKRTYLFYEEREPHSIKNIKEWILPKSKYGHISMQKYVSIETNTSTAPRQHFEKAIAEGNLARIKAYFRWGGAEYLKDRDILPLLTVAHYSGKWQIYWYFVDNYSLKDDYMTKMWQDAAAELLIHDIEGETIFKLIDKAGGFPGIAGSSILRNMGRVKNVDFLLKFYIKYHDTDPDINSEIFRGMGEAQNVELFEKYISYTDITSIHIKRTLYGAVTNGHLEFVVYLKEKYTDIITAHDILFALTITRIIPDALILKYAVLIAKETGCLHSEDIQNSIQQIFKYVSKEELLEIMMEWISNI